MNTAEYRDEISALSDAITSFKGCPRSEREAESKRLHAAWRRLASLEQPLRVSQADIDKRQRLMKLAVALLDDHFTDQLAAMDAAEHRAETSQWMETQAAQERWGVRGTA